MNYDQDQDERIPYTVISERNVEPVAFRCRYVGKRKDGDGVNGVASFTPDDLRTFVYSRFVGDDYLWLTVTRTSDGELVGEIGRTISGGRSWWANDPSTRVANG